MQLINYNSINWLININNLNILMCSRCYSGKLRFWDRIFSFQHIWDIITWGQLFLLYRYPKMTLFPYIHLVIYVGSMVLTHSENFSYTLLFTGSLAMCVTDWTGKKIVLKKIIASEIAVSLKQTENPTFAWALNKIVASQLPGMQWWCCSGAHLPYPLAEASQL